MNHRERILSAVNRQEPDRIPIDLGATESSGITVWAYNALKNKLGIPGKSQIYDISQMIAKVDYPVLEKIGADAVPLLIEPRRWKYWILQNGLEVEIPYGINLQRLKNGDVVQLSDDNRIVSRCPMNGLYFDTVYHPLSNITGLDDIDSSSAHFKSFDWPEYLDEDFNDLQKKAKYLYEKTDYAIVGNLWVHMLAAGQILRGFENFMMDIAIDKPLAHRILRKQLDAYLPRVESYIKAVGPYVQIIQVNDDLGTQNSMQMSPQLYREMVKPYHKELWGYIKRLSQKPLLLHSCGSIYEIIPDLIEIGVDALNPIQVSAANMDSAILKKEFGKELAFWGGGCDTQNILSKGTVKQVREEVKKRVDDLAPGGGFVFCQVHNIQPDVPIENILAMYEELGTLSV